LYATKQLNDLEISFKNGDKSSLMFAIFVCASTGLPLPPWASFAYSNAWADTIVFAKYKSWDAAFGLPYPKGAHLNAIRKERRLKNKVYSSIEDSINAGVVVDAALFEAVGKKYGLCKTLASEYYYSVKARVSDFHEIIKTNGIT
jgi:hypothetical protein